MGRRDYFKLGDHNATCYVCGFKRKASEMKLRWDGVYTCREDWEIRQPQDFVRGLPEETAPAWTQPMVPPIYDEFNELAGTAGPYGGVALLDAAGNTIGVQYTNYALGTPVIFLNGVALTVGVDYTINILGQMLFVAAPPSGSVLSWSGTWVGNAQEQVVYTNFPFALGTGFSYRFALYNAQE